MNSKKVLLVILDGYGEGKDYQGNAITNAHEHYIDQLRQNYPTTLLKTDSEAVGLPPNTMGGSEVGHFTIGAGRVVFQTLERINRTIADGSFFENQILTDSIATAKENNRKIHLFGMISDAGVHSHITHLFALLELLKKQNINSDQVFIHAITDGRDVPEKSASKYLQMILDKTQELQIGQLATICGRFYSMDRDQNWDRTKKAYELMTKGIGATAQDPLAAIQMAYQNGAKTDYYIEPIILDHNGLVQNQDLLINFDYRSDRAAQITQAFTEENFAAFKNPVRPNYVCFGPYSKIAPVVFPPESISNNLGEVIANQGFTQLRMAETEKFPHVTFFFNSQNKDILPGEKRLMVDSPKVASYAEKPEMSARELTDAFVKEIKANNQYKLAVINYANADLVGHSGELEPTKESIDVVNQCLQEAIETARSEGYEVIVTADHGNAEYMIDEKTGEKCPSHTLNKVICILVSDKLKQAHLHQEGVGLQDIAPTILQILGLEKPKEMTGNSLITPIL